MKNLTKEKAPKNKRRKKMKLYGWRRNEEEKSGSRTFYNFSPFFLFFF
jgi:hypothetical protein